jgi:hypothetical protein
MGENCDGKNFCGKNVHPEHNYPYKSALKIFLIKEYIGLKYRICRIRVNQIESFPGELASER